MRLLRIPGLIVLVLLTGFAFLWGGLALRYQLPFSLPAIVGSVIVWTVIGLVTLWLEVTGRVRRALIVLVPVVVALLFWWNTITPSLNRIWADDVAQTVTGTLSGNHVTLANIRNFEWRSPTDYTPRWEVRSYDLENLDSVDVFLSYWSSPAIAHTLVSFGFSDGNHVVFSAEIRKERHEQFSEIGGFFKEFELAMIAADERDIIRLRTNIRKEDVYRYRINLTPEMRQALFLSYLDTGNRLSREAQFYNTVTANCTTVIFDMIRAITPDLPVDYRIILSGYLPGYLYDLGAIDRSKPLGEVIQAASINQRAMDADMADDFSARIRTDN
ncbi:Lnb N-terminal periplasmic domain-containing protein [Phyllobacterium myrsinacearum]|uniref:Lnb N-terminal periplasmic domain-containing protein n=1 Tax=Phyllobacterium myrsinacearum TaxID=28101 RepID=A0A839EAZ5_9HYPH|nr:DUF4105 domain-containing protein [Phyllobacterium myrsinacearum]MBA8877041.1 hypothetical protein [Phyllobacterium myrsinacearum]